MRARGFTLVEMTIVISISALLLPLTFLGARELMENYRRGRFELQISRTVRTISEELALDLRTMKLSAGDAVVLEGPGSCPRITWTVSPPHTLLRTACDDVKAIATGVSAVSSTPNGVSITFSQLSRGDSTFDVTQTIGVPR